jgi:4-amino-4-deoxy-L-arabinose transferase-like glycosyltransferase
MATSPFVALQAGGFLSHVPAMFFAVLFLYAGTRYLDGPTLRWALLAAAALGMTFLTREITAVLIGLPAGMFLAARAIRRSGARVRDLGAAAVCLAAFALIYLIYDRALTGSAFQLPRHLFNPADRLGFGLGIGPAGRHTVAAGLVNTDQLLTSLNISLFGWPFSLTLAAIMLPFLLRRPCPWELLHGTIVGCFIGVHVAYFYHGIALGPRYYFEAVPSMAVLASRGFVALAAASSTLLPAFGRPASHVRAQTAALGLAALLLACNLLYFLPRQVELYRDYSGLPGRDGPRPVGFVRQDLEGRRPALSGALMTTTDWWVYAVYLAALNCPRLDCDSVFAYVPDAAAEAALDSAFPLRRRDSLQVQDGRLTVIRQYE